ncbi:MAG: hypothetical protein AAB362_02645 [Patescibacteria group bacterium]
MSKKLFIAVGLAVIFLIAGVYVYFVYFYGKETIKTPQFPIREFPTQINLTDQKPPEQKEPAVAQEEKGVLRVLTEEPIIGGTLSREGNSVLYIARENGNIYRTSFSGDDRARVSNQTLIGLYYAHWSPDKTKVFLAHERNDEIKKIILDLTGENPTSSIIPSTVRSGTWSSDGKIFYSLEEITDGVRLVSADGNNKNGKERLKIPLGDLNILPYPNLSILFTSAPSGIVNGPLFKFNIKNGAFEELSSGFGMIAVPSPKNTKLLVSKTTSSGTLQGLRIVNTENGQEEFVAVITLAEKCAWVDEYVFFCGVPKEKLSKVVLPDEYYKGLFETNDLLIRVDTRDASITNYSAEGFDRGIDIQDMFTDTEGANVFFRDQKTNLLYRFILP